ncbi:MAG: thioesterase family protein, partial [Alphaproteobacteria bacterium]|nr:thioesterase family protein [Alphaproteobacteria bacterium]
MLTVFHGMANTWECDENGHLNVRFYAEKVEEGLAHLYHQLGLTRAVQKNAGALMRIRDQHIHYKREVRPGEGLFGRAGLLEVRENGLRAYVELVNGHTDEIAAIFNLDIEYRSLADYSLVPLPARVAENATGLLMELPDFAAPRSIPIDRPSVLDTAPPSLDEVAGWGLHEIARGQVLDWECDANGLMHAFYYLGRISDGVVHLARHFRPRDTDKARSLSKYGGAVLEYRLRYS